MTELVAGAQDPAAALPPATAVAAAAGVASAAKSAAAEVLLKQADDPERVRASLIDAASMSRTLWVSFILFGTYLVIAAGSVTHRQLFLEQAIKLPVLNVDLPLVGFFVVAPVLLIVFHVYLLLHLQMMADDVRRYSVLLRSFHLEKDVENNIRQQLPNFVYVRLLGGPRDGWKSGTDWLLIAISWITVVIGPLLLLLLIQLQFLPFHLEWVTWGQRLLFVLDLALLWWFWPDILNGIGVSSATAIATRTIAGVLTVVIAGLSIFVATFPGERMDANPIAQNIRIAVPAGYFSADAAKGSVDLTTYLFRGPVNEVSGRRNSWLSNTIVLPGQDFVDDEFFAKLVARQSPDLPAWQGARTVSFRGRDLRGAVFVRADLRQADFTGARLEGADFREASLQGASFSCAETGRPDAEDTKTKNHSVSPSTGTEGCAWLMGARFDDAHLDGVSFEKGELSRASFVGANLAKAQLDGGQFQGANFLYAELPGASLADAGLEGATLISAELPGANLESAHLEGATFASANLRGANLADANLLGASFGETGRGAQLQGAILDGAGLQSAWLYWPQLQAASLEGANLSGAFLDWPELQGADLSGATLIGTSMANAIIWRSDVSLAVGSPLIAGEVMARALDWDSEENGWKPRPLTDDIARDLMARWLDSIPAGEFRDAAGDRLKVLLAAGRTPQQEAEFAANWRDLMMLGGEHGKPDDHAEVFRREILAYACDGGLSAVYAIEGMLPPGGHTLSEKRLGAPALAKDLLDCPVAKLLDEETRRRLSLLANGLLP